MIDVMKKMITISYFIYIAFSSIFAQDPHSSFIGISPGSYNPALAGVINHARTRVEFSNRLQWSPVVGARDQFRTMMFSADHYFCLDAFDDFFGVGIYAIGDQRGQSPLRRFDANIALSYRKRLSDNSQSATFLSIGGKIGLIGHRIDFGNLTFDEQFDNPDLLPEIVGENSSLVPDYGAGVSYGRFAKKPMNLSYEVGLSLLHLNRPDFSLFEEPSDERLNQLINNLLITHFSMNIPINPSVSLNPSIIYRRQLPHQQLLLNTNILLGLNRKNYLSFGAGYRVSSGVDQWNGDALIGSFGLLFNEQFELSCHYEAGTFVQGSIPQSLEARVSYRFGSSKCKRVYCPNY